MNFIIGPSGFLSGDNISLIIKDKITAYLFEAIKPGGIIEADLIAAATGAENSLSGTFSLNGKIWTAVIPEDLYNEFTLGKTFDNNFNIPVKLQLETVNNDNNGNGAEIIFKVLTGSDSQNIQKALDLYNKIYSDNIIGIAVKSFFAADLNPVLQNVTASVKGNFLFVHINFGAPSGSGSIILTPYYPYIKDAEDILFEFLNLNVDEGIRFLFLTFVIFFISLTDKPKNLLS